MNRLRTRLEKLESAAQTLQWNWNYSDVQECARKKLSAEEVDLLDQAIALLGSGRREEWNEAHLVIWKRWDVLLAQATAEVHFPVYIHADDTLL
jgi:hypothetical protein